MAYEFYVFERYDLIQLAKDVDEHIRDVHPDDIVSITHSSATDDEGVRYSVFVVLKG